jgi:4-diphosphocytidyl-2-C-methyl-D-erythritol kinase
MTFDTASKYQTTQINMQSKAYAKINWDLHVLGRRPDGFHALDTVMVNVSLYDTLEFKESPELKLTCSDPTLPTDERNLVCRAAKLLAKASHRGSDGVNISLTKNIPSGGGMGGGSSDAACTLLALNKFWNLNWSIEQLQPLAAQLCSDVAFFLYGGWCRCLGRGEIVERLPGSEQWSPVRLLLLLPTLTVSTPEAYKRCGFPLLDSKIKVRVLTEVTETIKSVCQAVRSRKVIELHLYNSLTDAALQVEPRLKNLQRILDFHCGGRWLMSGSGSVHFVVLGDSDSEADLTEALKKEFGVGIRVLAATTLTPEI